MKTWEMWLRGIVAAAISGLGTGMTGWAVGVTSKQLQALIVVNMGIAVGAYLKQSPLPPPAGN
jgi:hypothetical protein